MEAELLQNHELQFLSSHAGSALCLSGGTLLLPWLLIIRGIPEQEKAFPVLPTGWAWNTLQRCEASAEPHLEGSHIWNLDREEELAFPFQHQYQDSTLTIACSGFYRIEKDLNSPF